MRLRLRLLASLLAVLGLCACSIDGGANTASAPCVGGADRGGTQTPTLDSVRRSPDHLDRLVG